MKIKFDVWTKKDSTAYPEINLATVTLILEAICVIYNDTKM